MKKVINATYISATLTFTGAVIIDDDLRTSAFGAK